MLQWYAFRGSLLSVNRFDLFLLKTSVSSCGISKRGTEYSATLRLVTNQGFKSSLELHTTVARKGALEPLTTVAQGGAF